MIVPRHLAVSLCISAVAVMLAVNACSLVNAPDDPVDQTGSGGAGGSAGCVASACPGVDTDCRYRICDADQCAMEVAAAGTACADDGGTACDANGMCVAKSPSGAVCSAPGDCASGFCADGVCCEAACDGVCVACDSTGSEGNCAPHAVGTDPEMECPAGQPCDGAGACAKGAGEPCTSPAQCGSGYCTDGVCCDTQCSGICESCVAASTGGQDGTCAPVTAGTDPDSECGANLNCNGGGACGCPIATGNQSIDGPVEKYLFCWYLTKQGGTCDQACTELGGTNLAVQASNAYPDNCSGASANDVSTIFFNNGNAGGWLATTGSTSYHTLGYGYAGQQHYGKCAGGTVTGHGTFPGDNNSSTTRALVCPCFTSTVQ